MITVDVVIPTFNSGGLLREALDSVAAQTCLPKRVIVVDDGSSDGAVAPAIAGRPSVTVIRQANAGVSAARNTGVARSNAEALLILDHDDLLSPNGLELLADAMRRGNNVNLVHGMVHEFVDDRRGLPDGVRAAERVLPARLSGCTLIRRALWEHVGGCIPGMTQGEWIDWIDRAMASGAVVETVPEVVLHRRIHANNFTRIAEGKLQYLDVARAALARKRGGAST